MLIAQHSNEFTNIHFDDNDWENLNTQYLLADSILQKLNEYWEIIDNTTIVATILDPRTKCSTFTLEENTRAIEIIKRKINNYAQNNNDNVVNIAQQCRLPQSQTFNRLDTHAHLKSLVDKFRPTTQSVSSNELERYLSLPQDDNCDSLIWWNSYKKNFPILSAMAKDHLTIQATSVSCEQAFSIAGLTISKVRNRLNPETACALLCLKSWITEKIGEDNNEDDQPDSDDDGDDGEKENETNE
ncbi:unnamed protein product [Rhizophagus irregularis]|nr:unnamed protein product [Rhizophagus irregularis]